MSSQQRRREYGHDTSYPPPSLSLPSAQPRPPPPHSLHSLTNSELTEINTSLIPEESTDILSFLTDDTDRDTSGDFANVNVGDRPSVNPNVAGSQNADEESDYGSDFTEGEFEIVNQILDKIASPEPEPLPPSQSQYPVFAHPSIPPATSQIPSTTASGSWPQPPLNALLQSQAQAQVPRTESFLPDFADVPELKVTDIEDYEAPRGARVRTKKLGSIQPVKRAGWATNPNARGGPSNNGGNGIRDGGLRAFGTLCFDLDGVVLLGSVVSFVR